MAQAGPSGDSLPESVLAFLRAATLVAPHEHPHATALTGGVSSDIWRVDLADRSVCVKRALARLRVAQRWEAPVGRNVTERRWMQTASAIVPGIAPRVIAHDDAGMFAMEYLDAADFPVWKAELHAGRVDPAFARGRAFSVRRAKTLYRNTSPSLSSPRFTKSAEARRASDDR